MAESRYASKSKSFKRLKANQWCHNPTELIPRDNPLPVIRISSCYSEQKVRLFYVLLIDFIIFVQSRGSDRGVMHRTNPDLLLVRFHQVEMVIMKHVIQGHNNEAWMGVKPSASRS